MIKIMQNCDLKTTFVNEGQGIKIKMTNST